MKSCGATLLFLIFGLAASARLNIESDDDDARRGRARSGRLDTLDTPSDADDPVDLLAPRSPSLNFPNEVLASPECAAAGEAEAAGYLLFTENKDTNDRNFNSADVGFLPAGLPGPVHLKFKGNFGFELVDLARGWTILPWVDGSDGKTEYMGMKISTKGRGKWYEREASTLTIEPSVPTTLLVRVVIHVSKQKREEMKKDDGISWSVGVSWPSAADSPAKGCGKSLVNGLKVPHSQLLKMHTAEYMPYMPGFLAVLRRASQVTLQMPAPSADALEALRVKATQGCAKLPAVICRSQLRESLLLQAETGFACGLSPEGHSCVAVGEYQGSAFKLEVVSTDERRGSGSLVSVDLEARPGDQALEDASVLEWTVTLPATLPIGRAALLVHGQFAGAVAIICNPWSPDDPTFLTVEALNDSTHDDFAKKRLDDLAGYDNEEARRDYVLKTDALIFKGAAGNGLSDVYGDEWNYHQFRSLYYVLALLDHLPVEVRADIVALSRKIPLLVNSHALVGNWNEITDGEQPGFWTSAADILGRAYRMSPIERKGGSAVVRWGQCFVFGGVTGAVLRGLGIPARTLTNFGSAHDHGPNYDWFIRDADGDSVWNFHVWNEAWFQRADLYGSDTQHQWNVLDATPQEMSDGLAQMGPAALSVIRRGVDDLGELAARVPDYEKHVNEHLNAYLLKYDVPFAIAQVNSVQALKTKEDSEELLRKVWKEAQLRGDDKITCKMACHSLDQLRQMQMQNTTKKIESACPASCAKMEDQLLDFHTVGRFMSTEAPRCGVHERMQPGVMGEVSGCREDLTANYKASPCPTKEFCSMMEAQAKKVKDLNLGSRTYLTSSPKVAQIGDTIEIDLWQEQPTPLYAQISVKAMTYDAKILGLVDQFVGPWNDNKLTLKVPPEKYAGMLDRTVFMKVEAATFPHVEGDVEIKQSSFFAEKIITLLAPKPEVHILKIDVKPPHNITEEVQWFEGDYVIVGVKWRNPFPFQLRGCKVGLMTSDTEFYPEPLAPLRAHEFVDIRLERAQRLTDVGTHKFSVAVDCRGFAALQTLGSYSFTVESKTSSKTTTTATPSEPSAASTSTKTTTLKKEEPAPTTTEEDDIPPETTHETTTTTEEDDIPPETTRKTTTAEEDEVPEDDETTASTTTQEATTTSTKTTTSFVKPKMKACKVGTHVPCCPNGECRTRCSGDQCCPGKYFGIRGSFTCPSASMKKLPHCAAKFDDCTSA